MMRTEEEVRERGRRQKKYEMMRRVKGMRMEIAKGMLPRQNWGRDDKRKSA